MQLSPALQPPFSFHLGCGYDDRKMRKKREVVILRRGKEKKRLRGGKIKNRCMKENEKENGIQKTNSDVKKTQETGEKIKETSYRKKGGK